MIDRDWAETFARQWVDSWNARDLDRILSYYADDFEMTSPLIVELLGVDGGKLKGKEAVGSYWRKALALAPSLRFEFLSVMAGVNSIAILYNSLTAKRVALERIEFDDQQRGVRAEALHGPAL